MKVLFVKLTSMGDLIHALPALTDAYQAIPNVEFDWVVDASFAEIPSWHSGVKRQIKTSHRRWRKKIWDTTTRQELKVFWQELRQKQYDYIIDGQSNFKSALISLFAHGPRYGMDKNSARESIAHYAYQHQFLISKKLHAVQRLRELMAFSLGYPLPTTAPNFGIDKTKLIVPHLELPDKYLFFVPNASWVTKLWPEAYWLELINLATAAGHTVLLPSGNAEETQRAQRLAAQSPLVQALPRMRLAEVAYILTRAQAVVSVDTGLSHLAAALDIPGLTLYGATDSGLVGATGGAPQLYLQADFPCAPCYQKHCTYPQKLEQFPPCFTQLPPKKVWQSLQSLLNKII